eukprot:Nitzschia sp. Nitz4//scaffold26_size159584//28171//30795//NITZ4_002474-RA/size159584-processed-gene-0.66-mRNA-1//-1//CDS//3329545031//3699//frame0
MSSTATMAVAGGAGNAGTKVDVTLKLSQLQNLCKRDPTGYREDYDKQVKRLESELGILKLNPQSPSSRVVELIQFAAAVSSSSYKGAESDRIANLLIDLLLGGTTNSNNNNSNSNGAASDGTAAVAVAVAAAKTASVEDAVFLSVPTMAIQLHREVRKTCVSALILMRNKGSIPPLRLLELFFRLMAVVPDKALRELLYGHMVNDIRNINKKGKRDDKVNRAIQSFLHRVVTTHGRNSSGQAANDEESATEIAVKRATDMVCELYRRKVWTDTRTVAILATAVSSSNLTVMSRAMRFFLNIEDKMAQDAKQVAEDEWDASQKIDYHKFSRKTASRQRHVERQVKNRQRQQRKREGTGTTEEWMDIRDDQGVESAKKLYPAIELLRDPQGLAESVLKVLKSPKSIPYQTKLLMMNFVTRLVGNHELLLLPLYSFLQKYMGGSQRDVTAILAYTVQACHEHVPPEEIYGILKTIAHNFVTDRCSEEQMAVGINAIRAICARVPPILSEEESRESDGASAIDVEAFVRDIAAYSNHRDRSVGIAGKAFMNFIRETHPGLLQGKDRGLKGSALHKAKAKPMRYGESRVSGGVEGADLLVEYESKRAAYMKRQQSGAGKGEEEDDEGWEDVGEEEQEQPDSGKASAEGEDDDGWEEVEEEEESEDEEAPDLVVLEKEDVNVDKEGNPEEAEGDNDEDSDVIDLSKMTPEEREALKQEVSANRVFSASDFAKIRKLLARQERIKSDPREAARLKRLKAQGIDFEPLSGDEMDDDDDEMDDDDEDRIRVKGMVNVEDIQAAATRKRQSKADKLQKVLAGRQAFESKGRAGGSTNTEKLRKKNFLMLRTSRSTRAKGRDKGGLSKKRIKTQTGHEAKKRRRK